jgi:CspA family cold shock protein
VQGVVKAYDPETGYGVVVIDGSTDAGEVYLRPGSLDDSIFRTLRQGQRIVFEAEQDGDRSFATAVRIGSDGA